MNRVLILNVRIDVTEWLTWAKVNGVRHDVIHFVEQVPDALLRPIPDKAVPFSTPRAWASLSRALDLVEKGTKMTVELVRALAYGRVSEMDASMFVAAWSGHPASELLGKLNLPLSELDLSIRTTNLLESEGMTCLRDLVIRTEDELFEIRNFGERSMLEVKEKLANLGLSLGMVFPT